VPGQLTFVANMKYAHQVSETKASAIIVSKSFPSYPVRFLRANDPYFAFAKALELFYKEPKTRGGIHPTAIIGKRTRLGSHVTIGAHTVVGDDCWIGDQVFIFPNCTIYSDVTIGQASVIHSNCTIRERTVIGRRVIIHNGATVGTDGFGFAKNEAGEWYKIVQAGRVVVADDVEVGANTTIDRAAIGQTEICRQTKIDNLVQIGHGSTVGENSLLCAQVGLAGSTTVGKNVILAGQVGAAGHLTIGDNVVATAQTGIPSSVGPDQTVSGYPAIDNATWLRAAVAFRRLPEMLKEIRRLHERVEFLEAQFTR
jgi:UDP-3-O-[3-hydroxymyristoyl] glucosamine N-acyltransferase